MTGLKLRASAVVVETAVGRFSARAHYKNGLNVISARNNRGKTTLLMGAIYALGLEGMLGPGQQMPLKPAAYELLVDEQGVEHPVLSSYSVVEVENAAGERLTAQRHLRHERFSRDLVRTWRAGRLTAPETDVPEVDRFTRVPGSASRDAGWHAELERFIGWRLPQVTNYSGRGIKLYLETVAPMLIREQTRGWTGIFGAVPRHLQIRDPGRRAVEFLLGLDAYERARRREELRVQEATIVAEWRTEVGALVTALDAQGARLEGVDQQATVDWPPLVPASVRIVHDEQWTALSSALEGMRAELERLEREEIPRAADVVDRTGEELTEAERRLAATAALWTQIGTELRLQLAEVEALKAREAALDEDRVRYSDALKLRDLGALAPLAADTPHCPTCEQLLPTTLHGAALGTPVLTLETNLQIIDADRENLRTMLEDAISVLEISQTRARAVRERLDEARREVRTLKSALVQDARAPSRAVIARQVRLADRVDALEALDWRFGETLEILDGLAERLREVRGALRDMTAEQSSDDRRKLDLLGQSVGEQLALYGYGSFLGVSLDRDSYLPEREGFNLESASSASDTVRLVWAYATGLLETVRAEPGNHPGLVMFDEPGQHQMEAESLRALLDRLAATGTCDQQAIVATSLDFAALDELAGEIDMNVLRFDDRVLTREADPSSDRADAQHD